MWTLAIVVLVICASLGWTVNAALYHPRRVKPLYRLLYRHSAGYRHFRYMESIRAITRGTRAAEKAIGERMMPAMEKAAQSMRDFMKAYPSD
jgi:hypothetical protein